MELINPQPSDDPVLVAAFVAAAEIALPAEWRNEYLAELGKINGPDTTVWEIVTATPAQRAAALRTVSERTRLHGTH